MRGTPLLLWLVACTDPMDGGSPVPAPSPAATDAPPACAEPLELTLGSPGEPWLDGHRVTLWHGGQSGWHLEIEGRTHHSLAMVEVEVSVLHTADGVQLAGDQVPSRVALVDWTEASCAGRFLGVRALLDDLPLEQADICALVGEELTVEVVVSEMDDPDAPPALERVQVIAALDPRDEAACGAF